MGSISLVDLPPELITHIANNLSRKDGLEGFSLSSKTIRVCCKPALYWEIARGTWSWKLLFDYDEQPVEFPEWCCHVRKLVIHRGKCGEPPISFKQMLPALKHLVCLTEIDVSGSCLLAPSPSGMDELAENVPSLRVFKWGSFIDIDENVETFSLRNLEDIDLKLESGHGTTRMVLLGPFDPIEITTPAEPRGESPFTSLSSLSKEHPHLRILNLCLNYSANYLGARYLAPGLSDPLFSNTFEHLTHFSLKGIPTVPNLQLFSDFLIAHPFLRHFAFTASYPQPPIFPMGVLPFLEYIEGPATLIAAVCNASTAPRLAITEIRGLGGWTAGTNERYTRDIFPQLPRLKRAYINIQDHVSPEWVETLGRNCPELESLSLHDPKWIGPRDNFARAFDLFPHLRRLETSTHFGDRTPRPYIWYPMSNVEKEKLPPPEESPEALVWAAACGAPQLETITWGDESSGCVMTPICWREVERGEGGEVECLTPPKWG